MVRRTSRRVVLGRDHESRHIDQYIGDRHISSSGSYACSRLMEIRREVTIHLASQMIALSKHRMNPIWDE
jgi:hypothetical protein